MNRAAAIVRSRGNQACLHRCLILLAVCLFTGSGALAAAPAPAAKAVPKARQPTGYALRVEDEVDLQNVTCDQLAMFLTKPVEASLARAAWELLNQPQNIEHETSLTLFGPLLNNMIITSSGLAPPCQVLISMYRRGMPSTFCGGEGLVGPIRDLGMTATLAGESFHRPGELLVLNELESAAKLKNCRY
ncbi:MAG: hypothetical protein JWM33_2297 [Caulobacteraceae bacterium]|nr:hypothetical protein [Caulobacteraceae bacterium]